MKNIFILSFSSFLILPFLSSGQVSFDKYFILKTGIAGIKKTELMVTNWTSTDMKWTAGLDFSVGLGFDIYIFKAKKAKFTSGLVYNNQSFNKKTNFNYFLDFSSFAGVKSVNGKFNVQRLSIPLLGSLNLKKINVYTGINFAYNFRSQRSYEEEYTTFGDEPELINFLNCLSNSNESYSTELKNDFEILGIVGLEYEISQKIKIGLEFRNDLSNNRLYHTFNASCRSSTPQPNDINELASNIVFKKMF